MANASAVNRQILLARRPTGRPTAEDFRMVQTPVPEVGPSEVLLKTLFLSLDPYMRGRMSAAKSYAASVELGAVMVGGTVSRVVASKNDAFQVGDLVVGYSGWQEYEVSSGKGLVKLPRDMARPSLALGVLGMPGFTAYMGLLDIGEPKAGETLVVAAASGAVGSVVGQVGKLKGCMVVGVAGGPEKCRYVTEELGFDVCLDHYAPDFAEQLQRACPKGIDIYFENVGGKVFDAVLPLLNTKARVPVCGLIAEYNATSLPPGPDRVPLLMSNILSKRLRVQGFIISLDYGHRVGEFNTQMGQWVRSGAIKYREDVVTGLEHAPSAFIGMLEGKNFGKLVVKVAEG